MCGQERIPSHVSGSGIKTFILLSSSIPYFLADKDPFFLHDYDNFVWVCHSLMNDIRHGKNVIDFMNCFRHRPWGTYLSSPGGFILFPNMNSVGRGLGVAFSGKLCCALLTRVEIWAVFLYMDRISGTSYWMIKWHSWKILSYHLFYLHNFTETKLRERRGLSKTNSQQSGLGCWDPAVIIAHTPACPRQPGPASFRD